MIDTDGSEASEQILTATLAQGAEPQLALREGAALAPRLQPAPALSAEPAPLDRERTVLLTGASGALGVLFARHLAREHGARQLLLVSRRGAEAPGTPELIAELDELGCEARVLACDVADRSQLQELLAAIPAEHPLGAVFHLAGVIDDGVLESLTPARLDTVMAPKVDAAWHLHELTRELELSDFVLFSSLAATLQSPGQGNYAAANAFLDALAQRRRAQGLVARSLGWGLLQQESGMAADLDEAARARLARSGLAPLGAKRGTTLFDRAGGLADPHQIVAGFDRRALRRLAREELLPPLLHSLVPAARQRPGADSGPFAARLAAVREAERRPLALALVREHVAAVLGHASATAIDPTVPFKDLGFDSLGAVELRNRLAAASGLRLEATLVFDHPSAEAVAAYLLTRVEGASAAATGVRAAVSVEEPIAIVGMSCRYPGGVCSPEQLWELLAAGDDAISAFPQDRGWDLERLSGSGAPGSSYVREGGFLHDAAEFDAAFFGISPHEALAMDPQQRLLLEVAWEALEDAGVDPAGLHGSPTGVFAGVMYHDYAAGLWNAGEGSSAVVEGFATTGTTGSVVSGRLAYSLGLQGPAVSIDTACSSSLVAMHLAAQALRGGECELAFAGGATVMATPRAFVEFSRQRGLAPDGRCKAFAAGADGTAWSEGAGLLLLERLSDAEANGHEPIALIRGSAVNQDGASNGLTAPNGPSQERVIRQALANAGLHPRDVDAVEAHGTGTSLGDPIEAQALLATYGQEREGAAPLQLGSLKSNLGHTQAAAGVAGVIKMALALRHEQLPQTLHLDEPTPHVDWESGAVELLAEPRDWKPNGHRRRAGVSSFGISGTNAHLILEEAPAAVEAEAEPAAPLAAIPLLLSAKAPEALGENAARLAARLAESPDLRGADVAFTLADSRAALEYRAAVVAAPRAELLAGLHALAQGRPHPTLVRGRGTGGRLAFLFPGQGSQWLGMGRELLDESAVFARLMGECEGALAPFVDWSLEETLRGEDGAWLDRVDVVQPALFATMVSLAGLWRSYGVEPDAVLGHSQGEIAAAVVAGALSLEDGARVSALRSRALTELAGKGGMVAVSLAPDRVAELIEPWAEGLGLAALNGPLSTVVSGRPEALRELLARCEADGVRARQIPVDYASHSPQVEAIEARLLSDLAPIRPRAGTVAVHSALSGAPLEGTELGPAYWYRSLREPVRFEQATRGLIEQGFRSFVEVSSHPVLTMAVGDSVEAGAPDPSLVAVLHTLRRDGGGLARFTAALAAAHAHGVAVDWAPLFAGSGSRRANLPTYSFQRRRFWLESPSGHGDATTIGLAEAEHPLLGAAIAPAGEDSLLLSGRLSQQTHPWLADHAVAGTVLLPAAALIELALEAATQVGAETVEELTIEAPLSLSERGAVQLQLQVSAPDQAGRRGLSIHSRAENDRETPFARNASGALGGAGAGEPERLGEWPPAGAEPLAVEDFYARVAARGFEYGPAFQGLSSAWRVGEKLFAEVDLGPDQATEAARFGIHPALLDAAFHPQLLDASEESLRVPFALAGAHLWRSGADSLRVRISPSGPEAYGFSAFDSTGAPVFSIESLAVRTVDPSQLETQAKEPDSLFALGWVEAEPEQEDGPAPELLRIGAEDDPSQGLAGATRAHTAAALAALQSFLADEDRAGSRLAILTEGAVACAESESPDPAQAAVWGLVRCAQAEHPGRLLLIDTDGSEASAAALAKALAQSAEPQLALREGVALVPRLQPAPALSAEPAPLDPERTVLLTGATGALGSLFARHLAESHGARHLLLLSRRGPDAPGAAELLAELRELGCEARALACDVAERSQLQELLNAIDPEHPLGAVFHLAGTIDDGLLESLSPERLAAVMAPKVDAACNLHELTRELELSDFVLFSSVAATLGSSGQGNYAAANAFLDALAQRRRAQGLVARSLGWGAWQRQSEMTAQLSAAQRARIARSGILPLSDAEGRVVFDRALAGEQPLLLPVRLDGAALRAMAADDLPAVLRALVRTPARRQRPAGASLAERLAAVPEDDREAVVLALVGEHVAAVLGHASATAVDPSAPFKDLGFDSLAAVELRNQLGAATGLTLPSTLIFDYPTAAAVAGYLLERLGSGGSELGLDRELERILGLLEAVPAERRSRTVSQAAVPSRRHRQRGRRRGGAGTRGRSRGRLRRGDLRADRRGRDGMSDRETLGKYLRKATGELRTARARIGELERRESEPIAIVGIGCRFPGGASSPARLWELLASGRDAIGDFPADRGWDLERLYDPDPDRVGKSYVREGGFLQDVAEFDAAFFGIGPREALAMDPQQRLLLEVAWEALEDAGVDPSGLRGSPTGVFAGAMSADYAKGGMDLASTELEGYIGTGLSGSVVSGRIAYAFGLEGPAVSIDTACSSSLVALHLAAQALRGGECELALAGGVTAMPTPRAFVEFSRQRAIAPDGRCKSFAAAADGAGFAEGAGLLLLERLSDAERNGHEPIAIVRGSAVNQDGASNGITAPNGPSQERVIRQALANAGLAAREIDAVEAHGTGTSLGDPIEAQALLATYGQEREGAEPLWLGSLKSNLGHTQAAAGVAGVIKMALALRHEQLPKTLHLDAPTPHVDWEAGEVELLAESADWARSERPRRAGISSFGISGTNAHVILEEAPVAESAPSAAPAAPLAAVPLLLSARSPEALAAQAGRLASHLREHPQLRPGDVAFTLASARAALEHRAAVVGSDREELLAGLDALAVAAEHPAVVRARAASRGKVAFVFPGQGSQWLGMARELLAGSAVFAARMRECEGALAPYLDWSLSDAIAGAEGAPSLDRIEVVQPVLFATMVSLAALWRAHGVEPDAVLGHSQGEIAAAVVAGALSLADGARLAALRSQAIAKLVGKGAMVSVALPAERLRERIGDFGDGVVLAAVNGPAAVTVACDAEALPRFLAQCEEEGVRAREVAATIPSHSHHVEPLREEVAAALAPIQPHASAAAFYSTVTAAPLDGAELGADYWYRNLREPVQFEPAIRRLVEDGFSTFVEISSHPVLTMAVGETVEDAAADPAALAVLHTLRRDEGGAHRFLLSLAAAHAHGAAVDWAPLFEGTGARRVSLPTYAFQRQRFWLEAGAASGDASALGQAATDHPLLGAWVALAKEGTALFTGRISQATHPWLADHAVAATAILPGTAFCELALRAGAELGASQLKELVLEAPLTIPARGAVQLQLTLTAAEQGAYELEIHSRPQAGEELGADPAPFTRHASGTLSSQSPSAPTFAATAWPPPGAEPLETADLYDRLGAAGIDYGPAFQGLEAAWRVGGETYAEVSLAPEQGQEAERFGVHPALLDAALHAALLDAEPEGTVKLPFSFAGVALHGARGASSLRVRVRSDGERIAIETADQDGNPVCSIAALSAREVDPAQLRTAGGEAEALFALEWAELELGEAEDQPAELLRFAPEDSAGQDPAQAAQELTARALAAIQAFLADESRGDERLAILTEGAMAVETCESPDPALAAVWGLARSAQSEHPGRFVLIDSDGSAASAAALPAALAAAEDQLALREGAARVPRLVRAEAVAGKLAVPAASPWRLEVGEGGSLESLALVPSPDADRPLEENEVRVSVRAAGLNFRDVLMALGMYPGEPAVGAEGAGTVLEAGAAVRDLKPGDPVFGFLPRAFGPVAIADHRLLAPLPAAWTFAEGAAAPIVHCTALYGLVELAGLRAGERVLIHAGSGGVGMAAIQLAHHLGAEVFATASPAKWETLRGLGLDEDHIASSRTLEFEAKFLAASGGEGVDVVLDSLAREFVDASLRLLPRGGRFLEMGLTDVRDPEQVAAEHPGVSYRAFNLAAEASPEQTRRLLDELLGLFAAGALVHSPILAWDVRRAPEAFRYLSQARHTGKLVLTVAAEADPGGTVLLSGGLSGLGAIAARHLAACGARRLLLVSRRGADSPGAAALLAELAELGCEAEAVACDVSDRGQVEELLAAIPTEYPLEAVVHCAGVLDDGLVEALDPERLETVLAAKADAAWHLHELTRETPLSAFVLYSSLAASFGNPGQGNYAAANAFLDALAQRRRAEGLPATAIAWGLWEQESELTAGLGEADRARLERSGIGTISSALGMELFERARPSAEALVLAAPVDIAALRRADRAGTLPPLLAGLAGGPRRRSRAASGSLARELAALPAAEREERLLGLVREHAAAVLGHAAAAAIDPRTPFKDLGFDSLGAVELRNRLAAATGLRLEATLVFDHPSAAAVAAHLLARLAGAGTARAAVRAAAGADEPIAIVGIGCRYPGASSPEQLWQLLASGGDAISAFPADRGWDLKRLYDPDPAKLGKSYAREGGFLADATEFDAAFFGIGPREALAMDPQQRLLLEVAWEALEDAGLDPSSLAGASAGVFTGVMASGFARGGSDLAATELEGYIGTGIPGSVASGRVSYVLGLEGPAVSIDTACSSSLVALHLAAGALRGGECELALAGGATVMPGPDTFVGFSRQRAIAPDGRCKSFAAAADGAGFAEGAGLLLLERLSDAEANGHQPIALIRGSATNQDGASNGLTAPNGPSQERVIRQALANAGLSGAEVDAVEAHGTGTTLGDPIEAQALLATYGQDRDGAEPLQLGSLKSNIGHSQAAAGVGGVIKMALALRHQQLPKTLHLDQPTPHVDWETGAVELLGEPKSWPRTERTRRAGISSFGISGTNAHLILEEAPAPGPSEEEEPSAPLAAVPFLLSAKTPEALAAQAGRLGSHLSANPELQDADVALTLASARANLEHRAAVVGSTRSELLAGLGALAQGRPHPTLVGGRATSAKLAFLFPGQGSQWLGMGRELLDESAVFAARIGECEEALEPFVEWSLEETLRSEEDSWLQRVDVVQPALFATMVSLASLWRSHGVEPDAVLGHSQGEIAAAVLAGALSLEDGARVSALRSRALTELAGKGGMVSLSLSAEQASEQIAPWGQSLGLAALNGPLSTVVSGEPQALKELLASCEAEGIRARQIPVDYASHSPQVEAIEARLAEDLAPISPQAGELAFHSALLGERLDGTELGPEYWYRSLREPVRFEQATRGLLEDGFSAFVEVSSHPVLTMALGESVEASAPDPAAVAVLHTLRREGGGERFTAALAAAHAHGVAVEWAPLFEGSGARRASLPTYAFQRQRFWLEAAATTGDASALGQAASDHPLLGARVSLAGEGAELFTGRISRETHPWLGDHAVAGTVLLPAAALVELALEAATQVGAPTLAELTIEAPLLLGAQGAMQLQLQISGPAEDGRRSLAIHSRPEGDPTAAFARNASGFLTAAGGERPEALGEWPPGDAEPLGVEDFYERVAERGFEYGPAFQGLRAAWRRGDELFAEVDLGPEQGAEAGRFGIHPALLDAAFHPQLLSAGDEGSLRVPFAISGARLWQGGAGALRVRLAPVEEDAFSLNASAAGGEPVFSIESLAVRPIDTAQLQAGGSELGSLFGLGWTELELEEAGAAGGEQIEQLRCAPPADLEPPAAAHALCAQVLEKLQTHLADEEQTDSRLAILTTGAVACTEAESPDPAAASIWGLVRSAQAEHPGRFLLIDTDGSEASGAVLAQALAQSLEPQLALREGTALVPRLRPAAVDGDPPTAGIDPERTVLITGASGALGSLFARHLAESHGARHLLLLSRRGPDAPAAAALLAELRELGCEARALACDVADRSQLEALLAAIPAEHPLGAVFHLAGTIDDGVVESLTRERLDAVMAAKVDAAWNLHELTREIELSELVLFSSLAATLPSPGQGNYAAANAFLDALAQQRHGEGLPASSLGWGGWEREGEMTVQLSEAQRARIARGGILPFADAEGTDAFDRARRDGAPLLFPVRLDRTALRTAAAASALPAILRGLVRAPARRARGVSGSLAERLAKVPEAERQALVLALVREHVAAVLGHAAATAVDPSAAFKDLGFDSLGAVELRNQLGAASGLALPSTLIFDYPTATAVAAYLLEQAGAAAGIQAPADAAVDSLGAMLAGLGTDERERVYARLRALLATSTSTEADDDVVDRIQSASTAELLEIVNDEIGAK